MDWTSRVIIVLAWSDPEAGALQNPALVNDLNLFVKTPDCNWDKYMGNRIVSTTEMSEDICGFGVPNPLSNVEIIVIPGYTLSAADPTFFIATRSAAINVPGQSFAIFAKNARW